MKLTIEQAAGTPEVEIIIRCATLDQPLRNLIAQIQLYGFALPARRAGRSYSLAFETIYYFESVDEITFAYCEKEVYECPLRLYELEEKLGPANFIRISKNCIVNLAFLDSVRPLLGGRMEALLANGEKLLISRHYLPAFKEKFGLEPEGEFE